MYKQGRLARTRGLCYPALGFSYKTWSVSQLVQRRFSFLFSKQHGTNWPLSGAGCILTVLNREHLKPRMIACPQKRRMCFPPKRATPQNEAFVSPQKRGTQATHTSLQAPLSPKRCPTPRPTAPLRSSDFGLRGWSCTTKLPAAAKFCFKCGQAGGKTARPVLAGAWSAWDTGFFLLGEDHTHTCVRGRSFLFSFSRQQGGLKSKGVSSQRPCIGLG